MLPVAVLVFASIRSVYSNEVEASDLTASSIMQKMTNDERFIYISGIVDGIAYARFRADAKQETGMKCIEDWFYKGKTAMDDIYAVFGRYPDYPPSEIVTLLANKHCGGQ